MNVRHVLTRFAPAPTGFLHLGHVVNALAVWGSARARGGQVLLRIEDHDRQRSQLSYARAIIEDLAWLGFDPTAVSFQSERDAVYRSALALLVEQGLVYGCDCTRTQIEVGQPPHAAELRYAGRCRSRGLPLAEGLGWRLRLEPGAERFHDDLVGTQEQDPSLQCGDLLLRDRLGNWTYQFAVTADDCAQQVTDVIRGVDLLASTGRQIRVARLLGRAEPPRFAHHPLVMLSATAKLSKSDGAAGIGELRAAGWSAEEVRRRAASLVPLQWAHL